MQIQQIRNATLKIKYGNTVFLIDPWLQDKGTGFSAEAVCECMKGIKNPMNELPFSPEEVLKNVDLCLVTHVHPDHFTKEYLPLDMKFILQNSNDEEKVENLGFTNTCWFENEVINIGKTSITKVEGMHGDNLETAKRMKAVSGYILQDPREKTLYIAGDTVYYKVVEDVLNKYRPDVIVLNCCEATLPIGRLIMNCEDVLKVCKVADNAEIIASHLDSVNHGLVSGNDMRLYVKTNNLRQVYVPYNGEIMTF